MGRWRPPPPKSAPYITAAGYQCLQTELSQLWLRRRGVTQALAAAAAEGDRSENAEYIYRKKELGEIDRRIRYLQKRMPVLQIVTEVGDRNRIYFGARVVLEDATGTEYTYRIVGPDEIDQQAGYISIDSIMAKALLGKSREEEIIIANGGEMQRFILARIDYDFSG